MLYHQTKDILYVKEFLGHRKAETTLLHVQPAKALFKETSEEFTVRVASKPEEIQELLEVALNTFVRKKVCCTSENASEVCINGKKCASTPINACEKFIGGSLKETSRQTFFDASERMQCS